MRVAGCGLRVEGRGSRVEGAGSRVQGSGFRVQGSGFRVLVSLPVLLRPLLLYFVFVVYGGPRTFHPKSTRLHAIGLKGSNVVHIWSRNTLKSRVNEEEGVLLVFRPLLLCFVFVIDGVLRPFHQKSTHVT